MCVCVCVCVRVCMHACVGVCGCVTSPGEEEPGQFRAIRRDSHVGLDVGGCPASPPVISLPLAGEREGGGEYS